MIRTLGAHPRIFAASHGGWIPTLRRVIEDVTVPEGGPNFAVRDGSLIADRAMALDFAARTERGMRRAIEEMIDAHCPAETALFGDKIMAPEELEMFLRLWPEVKVIRLVRDYRDSLLSSFAMGSEGVGFRFGPDDWGERCRWIVDWTRRVDALLSDREHLVIKYERFASEWSAVLDECLGHLGQSYADEVGAYLESDAQTLFTKHASTASIEDSIGRWRRELTPEQTELVNELLEEPLRNSGYL